MSDTKVGALNESVQLTQSWLKELAQDSLFDNEEQAYTAMRAVLHALRDRLSVEEAVDLSAQLPMLVRGFYFEGWRPALAPNDQRSPEEFHAKVAASLRNATARIDPADATRAVFDFLQTKIDAGQLRHVLSQLPAPLQALWGRVAAELGQGVRPH